MVYFSETRCSELDTATACVIRCYRTGEHQFIVSVTIDRLENRTRTSKMVRGKTAIDPQFAKTAHKFRSAIR